MAKMTVNGILLIYHHDLAPYASNMFEHIRSFQENSQFKVWAVNTYLGFPKVLTEFKFQAIVLHYSLFAFTHFPLDEDFRAYLSECTSNYKVAFFQDEYHLWPERAEVINRYKIDCVYTCLEPDYYKDTYQQYTRVPRIETYLPGYASEEMVRLAQRVSKPESERTIDIGYRGRHNTYYLGKGAREKIEIGVRFRELAAGLGLTMDIETEEHKRIYGEQWLAFLANCRATLGVEAGSSIFDIDNVIVPQYQKLLAKNPQISFEEMYKRLLVKYDGKGVYYRTASPRVFEAAVVRTCQILYEGRYSRILEPMVHYIPLKKDFSNFDEVIRLYRDEEFRRELTENCYRDLIASGAYGYRRFIEKFDEGLVAAGMKPGISPGLVRQVTERLKEGEKAIMIKKVEGQRAEYQELMNKHVALQVQYMEQQKQFQEQHQALQVQYSEQQKQFQEQHQALQVQYSKQQKQLQLVLEQQVALQVEYMEQQKQLQQTMDGHQGLQVQYMEQQKQLQQAMDQLQALEVQYKELTNQYQALLAQYMNNWNLIKVVFRRIIKRGS